MGLKTIFSAVLLTMSVFTAVAQAGTYSCKVYCKGPDGSTYIDVRAGSRSEAAEIVDGQGDQICRSAGFNRATSSTMSSNQCN